jgi:hypothetical protein
MNVIEWLPQDHYRYAMPKYIVAYCRYAHRKMSVNRASMIFGPDSQISKK